MEMEKKKQRGYPVRDAIDFEDLEGTKHEGQIDKNSRH